MPMLLRSCYRMTRPIGRKRSVIIPPRFILRWPAIRMVHNLAWRLAISDGARCSIGTWIGRGWRRRRTDIYMSTGDLGFWHSPAGWAFGLRSRFSRSKRRYRPSNMDNGYTCLLQELTVGGWGISDNGADQLQTRKLPIGFLSYLTVIAHQPCGCAVGCQGHGEGCFFFAVGEQAPAGDAIDPQECPVGAVFGDMVFGHFPVNGLSF